MGEKCQNAPSEEELIRWIEEEFGTPVIRSKKIHYRLNKGSHVFPQDSSSGV